MLVEGWRNVITFVSGVDIWAVGCILAELLLRIPFVAGDSDLDQLSKIFQAMGSPTEETWPGHTKLPDFVKFRSYPPTPLADIFTAATPDLLQVLETMLSLDPNRRGEARDALQMDYFANKPYPSPGSQLPLPSNLREPTEPVSRTAGVKRKRDGLASSGLAKRLEF